MIEDAIAITCASEHITSTVTALLNKGWEVIDTSPAPHSVSKTVVYAAPAMPCPVHIDITRRKLEYVYGGNYGTAR